MVSTLEKARSSDPGDWPIFSYSQLQVWDRCEYQWYLGYEEEWTRKEKSSALNIGSLVHTFLEIYYSNIHTLGAEKSWNLIEDHMRDLVQIAMDTNDTNALTEIHRAGVMVKMYIFRFAATKDAGMSVLGVEEHFIIPLTTPSGFNFYLQGYIDLKVSKGGKIWIWDHKTSANAAFWKQGEILMDPQMTLYLAGLRRLGQNIHGITYNFLNSYDYKDMSKVTVDKMFKREETYRSPVEIENFEHQLLLQIDKLIKATGSDDYFYHRSLRRDCAKCAFQEPCLHGLKGINPEAILNVKFKKKEKMPEGIRPGSVSNAG